MIVLTNFPDQTCQICISIMIRKNPSYSLILIGHFRVPKTLTFKTRLVQILSCENEFYLHDIKTILKQRLGQEKWPVGVWSNRISLTFPRLLFSNSNEPVLVTQFNFSMNKGLLIEFPFMFII